MVRRYLREPPMGGWGAPSAMRLVTRKWLKH
jgi:hypothetical protein